MANVTDYNILHSWEKCVRTAKKAYVVMMVEKDNKNKVYAEECDEPIAVYVSTNINKAEKYIAQYEKDETYDYFIDCVDFEEG